METEFEKAFKQGLKGCKFESAGVCPTCPECGEDATDDAFFSYNPCDICGSVLGGDRYAAHCLIDGELCHLNACIDCICYMANGELPTEWRER